MQVKSELLNQILTDYLSVGGQTEEATKAVVDFCNYVDAWFLSHTPVGVSPAADSGSGVTIRFSDGNSFSLFPSDHEPAAIPGAAVSITGNAGGSVLGAGGIKDNSVPIVSGSKSN